METIFLKVSQGGYDKQGIYRELQTVTPDNVSQLLDWGLAKEITEAEFKSKANWGQAHYKIDNGITFSGNHNLDSSN